MRHVVYVVLVRRFGFHCLGAMISCVRVIWTAKYIRSDKDIKSNHGRQYIAELELYVL